MYIVKPMLRNGTGLDDCRVVIFHPSPDHGIVPFGRPLADLGFCGVRFQQATRVPTTAKDRWILVFCAITWRTASRVRARRAFSTGHAWPKVRRRIMASWRRLSACYSPERPPRRACGLESTHLFADKAAIASTTAVTSTDVTGEHQVYRGD
jgi:hypothetical protein